MRRSLILICGLSLGLLTRPAHAGQVLLYNGAGASPSDVQALEGILATMGLTYDLVNTMEINKMPETIMNTYRLIMFPGGNSIDMGTALSSATVETVHKVVLTDNVPYMGICAGAFMAGKSGGNKGFNLTNGVSFWFYQEHLQQVIEISFPQRAKLDIEYWDGPELDGWGSVVAKYPNAKTAIAVKQVGTSGYVLLLGVHPEAPKTWYTGPDQDDYDKDISYMKALIRHALSKTLPPVY